MLSAQPEQFTLTDDGQILFQEKLGNPLPGEPVARLEKGEDALAPAISLIKDIEEADKVQEKLALWLAAHINDVLAPLKALSADERLDDPVAHIGAAVYANMGVVPRAEIEEQIAKLDENTRASVRSKKIRLGPILVFQPDLNKPAPVRLRALLWSVFNGKALPAPVPKDGVVSYKIEGEYDPDFFQMIGYPVYGGRAIRIDMLDRVVNAVYEGAQQGKFKAQHTMAEWLGSSIEDLYKVLEALGHTKIYDPAEEAEKAKVEMSVETPEDELKAAVASEAAKSQNQEKPELATFALKKGKANQRPGAGKPKFDSKGDNKRDNKRDKKQDKKPKGKRNKSANKQPKVMSAEAKTQEDNPFAILEQLKKSGSQ